MDLTRDQLFARSRFAENQHARIRCGDEIENRVFDGVEAVGAPTLKESLAAGEVITLGLLDFGREFSGGLLLGAVLGLGARWVIRHSPPDTSNHWLTLLLAVGGYHLGQQLHVSGVMVCLAAGLLMPQLDHGHLAVWKTLTKTASGTLFLLMGATVTASMFAHRWLAMLIAIGAVVLARLAVMHLLLGALPKLAKRGGSGERLGPGQRTGLGLLGMRGAITLALALTLPVELPYWWTIQSIAYGVVMFDLLITAPLAPYIIRKLS